MRHSSTALYDSLCLVGDGVHDLADVLQVGDEGLLVDGVLLQSREDVLQPGRKDEQVSFSAYQGIVLNVLTC